MKNIFTLKIILIFTILSNSSYLKAQNRTISGTIKDSTLNATLESGIIRLINSKSNVKTYNDGKFEIEISPEENSPKIVILKYGYKTDTLFATAGKNSNNVFLEPKSQNLDEVVITGVSRKTLIKENPVAIISISTKAIEQTNESNIIDALVKNAPGLNAVKTGPNISKPFIRGLGYNRVLTLYDGIRQEGQQWGDEHGIEVDDYNIDRAEVIKGPASLMFGSDAVAGVVSLFPNIPTKMDGKIHGKVTSEYQTNNGLIGNGFRLNYSKNHFLTALRGSIRIAKNYKNSVDGRVYNTGFQEKNLSVLVGYKSDKGFSHLDLTYYDNLQGIPDGSRDSLSRKFTNQILEGNADDIKNRPIVSESALNSYTLSPLHQHIQHYRIYNQNYYKIGGGDIDALVAFQQNIRREYNHPTLADQAGLYVRLNTINYSFRYNAPKFGNFETSIGINGMSQANKSLNATDYPIPDYNLFDAGIYLYGKWKYQKWNISGGVRYDARHIKWNDFYIKTDPATGFDQHVTSLNTTDANLQFPSFTKNFTGISASLGATYKATEKISFKANIGRGYRSPNITELSSNGLDPGAHITYLGDRKFNPEFSTQEDIGASARFNDFSADLSFFNNNIKNYIYQTLLADSNGVALTDAQGNKTFQYLQGEARLYGMEASLSIHPEKIPGFSFDNSFSAVYGFNKNPKYRNKGDQGEYLPLIPPVKLLSSLSQKIDSNSILFDSFTPKVELQFNAAQGRYLGLNNSETFTPSYALVNIGLNTEVKYSRNAKMSVQFQINNLFDKAYQSNLDRLKYFEYYSQSPNGKLGIFNMGRNYTVKLVLPF